MWHTVAYQAALTATVNTDMSAITDGVEAITNGHILPQRDKQILYAYIGATTLLRARLNAPSLRQFSPPFIRPIDNANAPNSRTPVADYRLNPLPIKALEELQIEATDSAAGPNTAVGVVGLSEGPMQPMPQGQIISMRGTGTTTQVALAWTLCQMTWVDNLPAGQYACVGLSGFAATGVAARLVFEQQVQRPGAIIGATGVIIPHPMFLKGGLGVWGYFTGNRLPNVEVLSVSADTAQEFYLDLIKVG